VSVPAVSSDRNVSTEAKKGSVFSSNGNNYQLINLSAQQFILVKIGDTSPVATFTASSKRDVYHVKFATGSQTLGYFEDGKIVIDIPKGNSEFEKMIFTKN
jgi:hypothetical protein